MPLSLRAVAGFLSPCIVLLCSAFAPTVRADDAVVTTHVGSALDAGVYRLASGDSVRVDVYNEPDLSLKLLIAPSGKINYPFLGEVTAKGLTTLQLQASIAAGLRNGYLVDPDVRVSVAEYRPVYVTGEVRKPGAYPYTLGLSVQQAFTLAGGLTNFASLSRIYIKHENVSGDQRTHVTVDSDVLPGDTLIIEERTF